MPTQGRTLLATTIRFYDLWETRFRALAAKVVTLLPGVCGPVSAALALHLLFLILLPKGDCGLAKLVYVDGRFSGQPPFEIFPLKKGPGGGYDGQFYYALARNPWRPHSYEGIRRPAARHLRVLYPILCWLGSGGDPHLLLWIMPAWNLFFIGVLAYLGARLAVQNGMSQWWGFLLPVAVNAALPAFRNLTDGLSTLAVFALVASWLRQGPTWTIFFWGLAALFCREQNLLILLLIAGAALCARRFSVALGLLVVILFWVGWVCLLREWYGVWPFLRNAFAPPGQGYYYAWTHLGSSTRLSILNTFSLLQITACVAAALFLMMLPTPWVLKGLLAASLLLTIFAGPAIFVEMMAYRRVLVWLPMGIWLGAISLRCQWPKYLLAPAVLFSYYTALGWV